MNKLTTSEIAAIAGMISNQIWSDLETSLNSFKKELVNPKKDNLPAMYDRRKVSKIFDVTPDTVTKWVKKGILDPATYNIINGRYKFIKEKIDYLFSMAKAGTWEPNLRCQGTIN